MINEHTIRNEIAAGEGSRSEFKSSLRWYINGAKNDERIIEVLEAIAGFLNTVDGVLLIGARDDDGSLHGIASDGKIYHSTLPGRVSCCRFESESSQQRSSFRVTQIRVHADRIVLDFNHELAGHALTFDLRIVKVE